MKKQATPERHNKKNRKFWIALAIIAMVMIACGAFVFVKYSHYVSKVDGYNEAVGDYNVVAEGYISLIQTTSVENINGMPTQLTYKKEAQKNLFSFVETTFATSGAGIEQMKSEVEAETEELVLEYLIAEQITNPSSEWIHQRLMNCETVLETQKVTEDNDPNGYLGAEGGYTGCVYFTVKNIDPESVKGADIVTKGTDVGGAIEVYENQEDAMIRCEYLSQFDNTLLYSGSYAIVGTMVVRTSYILSNEQQSELTSEIVNVLTELLE